MSKVLMSKVELMILKKLKKRLSVINILVYKISVTNIVLQHRRFFLNWKQSVVSTTEKLKSNLSTKLATENSENILKLKVK